MNEAPCIYRPHVSATTAVSYYDVSTGLVHGVPDYYFKDLVGEQYYEEFFDGQEDVTKEQIWVDMFRLSARLIVFSYMNIGTYQYVDRTRLLRIWATMEEKDVKRFEAPPFHVNGTEWITIGAAKSVVRQASYKTPLSLLMYDKATNLVMTHDGLLELDIPGVETFKARPLDRFVEFCCDEAAHGLIVLNGVEKLCYRDGRKLIIE